MPDSLFDLKFIVLSGKGGVGRTAVAAALARAAAARGRRVLIAQTNAVERLGKMLGHPEPIGAVVRKVAPGIDVVNMTPKESLHQYALLVLKYESVYRTLFDNRAVRGFLSAIPGLDAYAMLGKAWWHTNETEAAEDEDGSGGSRRRKYDTVILDGPATGHTIAMLKIPRAIMTAAPTGPLVKDARALHQLLVDPTRAALVIVTRPEELPAREARELADAARDQLGIPLGAVIVNAVPPDRLSTGAIATVLDRLANGTGDPQMDATLAMANNLRAHSETAEQVISGLRAAMSPRAEVPFIILPWLPSTDLGPREIDRLSFALTSELVGDAQG